MSAIVKRVLAVLGILVLGVVCAVGGFLYYISTPKPILRHCLHLSELPSSISKLKMGSDVWTDAVYSFYFEIDPKDFPALLKGRSFKKDSFPDSMVISTMHIVPKIEFDSPNRYAWREEDANCEIAATADFSRVIVVFAAD